MDCPAHLRLHSDPTFLKEILVNLLQNAVKYTPDGGRIALSARAEGGNAVIQVKDTGYGIPPHQQKNVFQKFFRGENILGRDTSGSGLGLYLVSLMTDMLRGTIAVRSEQDKGTTFTLTLPLHVSQSGNQVMPSV